MTDDSGQKLGHELREAYGRSLPTVDFDDAVMERTLADSGGEHEVALAAPRGRRWWPVAVAAAMVLLFVGAWKLTDPTPQEAPPICVLPEAAAPGNERIVVAIDAEGKASVGGTVLTEEQLKNYLTLRAKECRADGEEEPYVHIEGDLTAHYRHIQKFLQLCADPAVRIGRFQFASGEEISVVEASKRAAPERISVVLKRLEGEATTRVFLNKLSLGSGETGFAELDKNLASRTQKAGELEAFALVPHQEIIRAIDAFMKVGIQEITFIGVPPPAKPKPRPALHLYLQPVKEHTELILYSSGGRMVCTLEEGLVALDAAIRKLVAVGPKPMGVLEAGVYMDQAAVESVLEVFKKHGIEDVTIIR